MSQVFISVSGKCFSKDCRGTLTVFTEYNEEDET